MRLSGLGRLAFHSRPGRLLLGALTRALYLAPVRRALVRAADYLLGRPALWRRRDRAGWGKIDAQYRWIARAVLRSVESAIAQRWLAPHVARRVFALWGGALFPSLERQRAAGRFRAAHGVGPPWFLVISPTRACNLDCAGCYANSGPGSRHAMSASLPWGMLDRLMTEARRLWGVGLFVFSGGEPLAYRSQGHDLLDIVERHDDCLFLMFTNGTLITPEVAGRLARLGNLTPSLSVEGLGEETDARRGQGVFDRVLEAMAHLRRAGVPFGISMTATRANCEQVLSDRVLDFYFAGQGAFYAFIFQYMPIGRFPDLEWMPGPEQRIPFWSRSWEVVRERRLFLLDFWNHGPLVEGCIAAGRERGYLHVDWNGDAMPCVFMPYVAANLHEIYAKGGDLNDVWASPLFREVRRWQHDYGYGCGRPSQAGNWLLPCPVRDHFATLRGWVTALEPAPQPGVASPALMSDPFCSALCAYGREEARLMQALWEAAYLE